jgi:predicted peptidase
MLLSVSGVRGAETGFIQRTYAGLDGHSVRYSIYIPPGYSPDRSWPVVLFLHGAGQAGTDGVAPTRTGLGKAIRNRDKPFPAIVVFPQAQKRERDILSTWHPDRPEGQRALAILDQVQKEFRVDPQRAYLTGISMGGYGAWALAGRHPERFAAIVPICGGGDRDVASALKDVPCWCFHGSDDPAVRVEN